MHPSAVWPQPAGILIQNSRAAEQGACMPQRRLPAHGWPRCPCRRADLPKIASWVWEAALQHAPHHPPSAPASGLTAAPGRRGRKECHGRGCLAAPVAPLHPSEPRLSAMAGLLTLAHSSKRCEKRLGSACRGCRCACTGRTAPLAPPQGPRTLPGSGVSVAIIPPLEKSSIPPAQLLHEWWCVFCP
jgi:hypothetical protein